MAELFVPEDYAQTLLRFSLDGDDEEMVVTFGIFDSAGTGNPITMAAAVDAAVRAAGSIIPGAANITTGYTYVGVTVRLMTATGFVSGDFLSGLVGTAAGSPVPQNSAYLVKKGTGLGGRRNQGRLYFPPIVFAETDVSPAGVIDSADVTAYNTNLANFLINLIAEDVPMFLFHYPTVAIPAPAPTAVTQLVMDRLLATQRRRLR